MGYLKQLYRMDVLSPKGAMLFLEGMYRHRVNLLALVRQRSKLCPEVVAVDDGERRETYATLYQQCCGKAQELSELWEGNRPQKIAFLVPNSTLSVVYMIACSSLGVDMLFVNPDLQKEEIATLLKSTDCTQLFADEIFSGKVPEAVQTQFLEWPKSLADSRKPKGKRMGSLVVLTGGSSGNFKSASRKSSMQHFLAPLKALVRELRLDERQRVYVGPPIYHGYGMAALILSISLGKSVVLRPKFNASEVFQLLQAESIEVMIAVPTMIDRLLRHLNEGLPALKCLVSGGARISEKTLMEVQERFGDICFNLYGTSESGFVSLANPADLRKYPASVGRPIKGVRVRLSSSGKGGSVLEFRNSWAMSGHNKQWISTGDLATINEEGYIFLQGRSDDRIVSGGENVHVNAVADKIRRIPEVTEAVCLPISDSDFGERIALFVVLSREISAEALNEKLKSTLARYEVPAEIHQVNEIPLNAVGKVSRGALYRLRVGKC